MRTSTQRILDTGNPILTDRPVNSVPRNYFNMMHDNKLSCEFGQLVPMCQMEVMPGDTWHIQTEALIRMQALISPVMHRVNVRSEWFFVPYRILWPNWEQFISPAGVGVLPPSMPSLPPNAFTPVAGDLNDYLGLPVGQANPTISAFFHAAYQQIYADWYMDEDLTAGAQASDFTGKAIPLVDGDNIANLAYLTFLQVRNLDRDYFTSAKPYAQKGPVVTIPMGTGNLPVYLANPSVPGQFHTVDGSAVPVGTYPHTDGISTGGPSYSEFDYSGSGIKGNYDPNGSLEAIFPGGVVGATINELRQAEALQMFLEADLRGGTRYTELLLNHFGVVSSDARLQRAEYLGSTYQPLVFSEVLNTTGTSTAPQGQMAGHGISVTHSGNGMHYYAEEHGVIMGIMSCMPATGYYQGIHPMFNRFDRLDFPFPEFAELGEQAILNQELFYTYASGDNTGTFGYVPRYAEWRIQQNRVGGTFKTSLDFWHLARKFSSLPTLTNQFILSDYVLNQYNRVFATLDNTGHILCHWFHKCSVERKLPKYVRPSV